MYMYVCIYTHAHTRAYTHIYTCDVSIVLCKCVYVGISQVWDICLHSRQPNVLSMTILRNLGYSITHATK